MNSKNQVVRAAIYVFGFWWCLFTLIDCDWSPLEVIRNWDYVTYSTRFWMAGVAGGVIVGVWSIWFSRLRALSRIFSGAGGNISNGAVSTLGKVPMAQKAPPRVKSESQRLPIESPIVRKWIEDNREQNPAHVALFMAIWDTYCAHPGYPATHRRGGHANRRLYQHCLAVTEVALQDAGSWVYEGVFSKKRGKTKRQVIAKRNPDFVFDAADPLIAIVALGHDFGKLEAYRFENGQLVTGEEGASTDHDDDRIFHDALGARMLARLPEYWAMTPRDRRTLNLVIAHYHHPSAFPVDANGLAIDDRMSALMEYLIYADRKTGLLESGKDLMDEENEITEEQAAQIYQAFVEIITEFGRINGTGNKQTDANFKIAQKHDGLIVVKELDLRKLMLTRLGWSLEDGEARYRVTMNLLYTLADKGLLYDKHNGVDFSRYHPMYSVSFRSSKNGQHISSWEPVLIFKPLSTTPEFSEIGGLPNFGSRLVINRPIYTHNPGIRDPEVLRDLVRRAFDEDVARSIKIDGRQETVAQMKARHEKTQPETTPGAPAKSTPATAVAAPALSPDGTQPVSTVEAGGPDVVNGTPSPTLPATPVSQALSSVPAPTLAPTEPGSIEPVASEIDEHEEISAAELPTIADLDPNGEADDFDDFARSTTGEQPRVDGSMFDGGDFDDFPPIPDSFGPVPTDGHRPADLSVTTESQPATPSSPPVPSGDDGQLLADRPGVPISDPDAPKVNRQRQRKRDAESLERLARAQQADLFVTTPPVFKKKKAVSSWSQDLALLKDQIAAGKVPVEGRHMGHAYVLAENIRKCTPEVQLDELIRLAKLPTLTGTSDHGAEKMMIGIPE